MNVVLRLEEPLDYRETENVTREAFWNHYAPGCDAHYLLHIMRDCPAFLPGLDVVAVSDGNIVGNVVYMKSTIAADDGNEYEVLNMGPISVLPAYQRKGIGGRMIEHTRTLAREMGFRAILLRGDPAYYSRQGFMPAERFGIRTADDMYFVALQACELYENALSGLRGRHFEDAIYEVDEAAAAAFDKGFPPKERRRHPVAETVPGGCRDAAEGGVKAKSPSPSGE